MARYELLIKPSAVKEIEGVSSKADRRRITTKIKGLAQDPRPRGCEKLSGQDRFRVRQGDCRIVYEVNDAQSWVLVVKVGHRREVYR